MPPEGGVFSNSKLMVEGLKLKWVHPNKKTSRISLQKKLTDLESGQVLTLSLKGIWKGCLGGAHRVHFEHSLLLVSEATIAP